MGPALILPRLLFGPGSLAGLADELTRLGAKSPLLVSDAGLNFAGLTTVVRAAAPGTFAEFLEVPENPTAAGADKAAEAFRSGNCDSIIALGGGSVLDTAKLLAAQVTLPFTSAETLIGHPELIERVVPLIAIPTTLGTGSESSPVAALHRNGGGPGIGTRSPLLVPRVAICDPDLTRSLPRHLVAATAIDALSHCVEGFFAEPANPIIDALALDGARRVFASIHAALEPDGDDARESLMAAAFAGGAAIHKGLGPAHAVALVCGDQHIHHGALIGVTLAATTRLLARHLPDKARRLQSAIGIDGDLADAIAALVKSLDLPVDLRSTSYVPGDRQELIAALLASPFNRTSPYAPSTDEYRAILDEISGVA